MSRRMAAAAPSSSGRWDRPWLRDCVVAGLPIGLLTIAAVLWLAVAVVPSTAHGTGSSISGHRFADLILSGVLSRSVPSWLGSAWYATPFAGAVLLACVGLDGRSGRAARSVSTLVGSASSLGFSIVTTKAHLGMFGVGAWCGTAAAACGTVGIYWDHHTRSTRKGNHVL